MILPRLSHIFEVLAFSAPGEPGKLRNWKLRVLRPQTLEYTRTIFRVIPRGAGSPAIQTPEFYFCGSMMTFIESAASATIANPSAVFSSGRRWVIISATLIRREAISSIAAFMSLGLPA